jgi:hypothetical protein
VYGIAIVCGLLVKYLLDTGAYFSYMKSNAFEKIKHLVHFKKMSSSTPNSVSCVGQPLNISGFFETIVAIGSYRTTCEVLIFVVNSLESDLILGESFINSCPILKPGLDYLKDICERTTIGNLRNQMLVKKGFEIDYVMSQYIDHGKILNS